MDEIIKELRYKIINLENRLTDERKERQDEIDRIESNMEDKIDELESKISNIENKGD